MNGSGVHERKPDHEDEWSRLMRLALDGDQVAYKTLLAALVPHVRGRVRHVLARSGRGQAEVEDIVQETLLAVHLKRATWDRSMPLTPWLNAVTRHKTIDLLRRVGARGEVDLDDAVETLAAPEEGGERQLDVHRMLSALDGRQRQIVEQVSLAGRSAAEVGGQLGMSEGAVRVALHRALKKLARTFKGRTDADR
ncbi:sigma-70 family RNA polymerase sigma factor [Bosea sp. RAC05]|jgi:RNA polymerase sigma factor (sigma-70 family)|uniref:sigma-70 family RNA polymerase sigma factor n=2 Tax=unclassified Bosea (in: a-proteobacteria) TaxID=2653178 RepID=UPI00083E6387|nr:sigma-70 family RNA polymerase sigma factor [Bosea sp. RAC05]